MKCDICEIGCEIRENETGRCRMYRLKDGVIVEAYPDRFMNVFPISIETMPTLHFEPRGKFLQISTVGCNLRCGGCISEILTSDTGAISAGLKEMSPDAVVSRAEQEQCLGIVFCVNDPVVSLPTFVRVARCARERGLYVGCSTNGYFTPASLERIAPYLDFVNFGFKGYGDEAYRACGAHGSAPVIRNLELLYKRGVHLEAAAIFMKGREEDVINLAKRLASLSRDIPFQIMRFVPFGEANMEDEPSIRESEQLCDRIREILPYTYLFNSPGTDRLNTLCPKCGEAVVIREFFGPMGARTLRWEGKGMCRCGHAVPIRGDFHETGYHESGFFGGYRTTRALEIIQSILECLRVKERERLSSLWYDLINGDYLQKFHKEMQVPANYEKVIGFLASRTGTEERGRGLVRYINEVLAVFRGTPFPSERPRVYYAMGYPLFALNAERIETNLVELAGGRCVNKELTREGKPGVTIMPEEFRGFNPEYIFISGFLSCPLSDFTRYCEEKELACDALRNGRIYGLPPLWDFGSLRWVLGLQYIARALHPGLLPGTIEEEAERFYRFFYDTSYTSLRPNRSFIRVG